MEPPIESTASTKVAIHPPMAKTLRIVLFLLAFQALFAVSSQAQFLCANAFTSPEEKVPRFSIDFESG